MILAFLLGCATLDSFIFNPIHCSTVGPETCEDVTDPWRQFCARCPDDYVWDADHPWGETVLPEGQSIRPIDPQSVSRAQVPTADGEGTLDGYYIPSHGQNPATAGTTIIYSHGNFGGLEHYLPRIRILHEAGYAVFAWDFRGYGKSEPDSTATPEQFHADARSIYDEALTWATDPNRVVVYGFSLGAIPGIEMALKNEPCAMILEAPFTSLSRTAQNTTSIGLGERMLSDGLYDNFDRITGWRGPLFALVGEEDRTFHPEDVRELARASKGASEFWIVPGARHGIDQGGCAEVDLDAYFSRIASFLDDHSCLAP
jgi:hypothetical protein